MKNNDKSPGYVLSSAYDPLDKSALFDDTSYEFVSGQLRDVVEKIFRLEVDSLTSNVINVFRNEFVSQYPLKKQLQREEWEHDLSQNVNKLIRYQKKLNQIAKEYGFQEENKKKSLEEYLLTDEIHSSGDTSSKEKEAEKWHTTREWDTVPLVRSTAIEKSNKKYDDIMEKFNNILKGLHINRKISKATLRKQISRAYDKKGMENLKILTGKE